MAPSCPDEWVLRGKERPIKTKKGDPETALNLRRQTLSTVCWTARWNGIRPGALSRVVPGFAGSPARRKLNGHG